MKKRRVFYTPEAQAFFPEAEEYTSGTWRVNDRMEIPEWPGTENVEFPVVEVTESYILVGVCPPRDQ